MVDYLRSSHRPIISVIFAVSLSIVLLGCSIGAFNCEDTGISRMILGIMGSYLGVYAAARSGEKIMELKK